MKEKRLTILEPTVVSKGGKDITDKVGKMTRKEATAAGIDYKLHPWILSEEEKDKELEEHSAILRKCAESLLLGN